MSDPVKLAISKALLLLEPSMYSEKNRFLLLELETNVVSIAEPLKVEALPAASLAKMVKV